MLIYPFDHAGEVLRFYREFSAGQPDELTTWAAILTGPDGNLVVALVTCYSGDLDQGMQVLAPIRSFGSPLADTIAPIPHPVMQGLIGPSFPHGRHNYWKSGLTANLSDALLDSLISAGRDVPSAFSALVIADCHGAYHRIGKSDTAYYHRDLQYDVLVLANWVEPADTERNLHWARACYRAIEAELTGGAYVNDLGDDETNGIARPWRELSTPGRAQDPVRPDQPFPHEPEHSAGGVRTEIG